VHVAKGDKLFEMIGEQAPDIIILDIMLPDVDGWKLLTRLREMPETRSTPIIICSVIRGQALALALGAALYVPKPVRRQQLIEALDRVSIGL
jgi:CheY-like chemotaxis protein